MKSRSSLSRRQFLSTLAMASGAAVTLRPRFSWAADSLDPRVAHIVSTTIGIDTHAHIDVPLTDADVGGPDIDLAAQMKRSGLSAICMTFATDYQPGDAYDRFLHGMAAYDRVLERNHMKRSLTAAEVRAAHAAHQPTVIQAIEGAHFLQGHIERVQEAYNRGLRHFGLLHDSDAPVPLGDVYTNPPRFGGLTAFGAQVIRECNRLGILVDLAHANAQTTEMALKVTTKPVLISHTGLDTQLGSDPRMAQMMRPRLISKQQAKMVADAGGAVGVWIHLSDTPLQFAQNVRALADVIGVDHVCIGTDTKLTTPSPRPAFGPGFGQGPGGGPNQRQGQGPQGPGGGPGQGPQGQGPQGPGSGAGPQGQAGNRPPANPQGGNQPRPGERTNLAWAGETEGFYYVVVDAMLKTGFTPAEIAKIGGDNYLRLFAQAVGK